MTRTRRLLVALLIPIAALAALAGWKGWIATTGHRVTLPIEGFDPRDLLSGHYLIYRIDYGVEGLCEGKLGTAYVCLDPKGYFPDKPAECRLPLRGSCDATRFTAGIERFYLPEDKARALDRVVRDKRGSVVLALDGHGGAQVVDLLIDGRSWKEWTP